MITHYYSPPCHCIDSRPSPDVLTMIRAGGRGRGRGQRGATHRGGGGRGRGRGRGAKTQGGSGEDKDGINNGTETQVEIQRKDARGGFVMGRGVVRGGGIGDGRSRGAVSQRGVGRGASIASGGGGARSETRKKKHLRGTHGRGCGVAVARGRGCARGGRGGRGSGKHSSTQPAPVRLIEEKLASLTPGQLLLWLLRNKAFQETLKVENISEIRIVLLVIQVVKKAMKSGDSRNCSKLLTRVGNSNFFRAVVKYLNTENNLTSIMEQLKDLETAHSVDIASLITIMVEFTD